MTAMPNQSPTSLMRYVRSLAAADEAEGVADCALVERFANASDDSAFAALVQRHGAMVFGVCRRLLGQEQDAEDVFQAVFLVLGRKASSLRNKDAVAPWLFGVAHRLALRARMQRGKRRQREAHVSGRTTADPCDELTVREAQAVLDEELCRLHERDRGPLLLCYLEGLTRDEAAQRLGCPLGTLKSRLERARALLHRRLLRRGVALSAALSTFLLSRASASMVPTRIEAATIKIAATIAARTSVAVRPEVAAFVATALQTEAAGWFKTAAVLSILVALGIGLGVIDAGRDQKSRAALAMARTDTADLALPDTDRANVAEPAPAPRDQLIARAHAIWRPHGEITGSKCAVRALAFSADGARIASGDDDGLVRVLETATGKELVTRRSLSSRHLRAVAFGGDGVAAGGEDGAVLVWNLQSEENPRAAFSGRGHEVLAITFGEDGQSLAWARCGGAVEWDAAGGATVPPLAGQEGGVRSVAFSHDGHNVAWGMKDGSVKLWDAIAKKELGQFRMHEDCVSCVAFSRDGRTIASVDQLGTLKVWDAETGHELAMGQDCEIGQMFAVAFSPDGEQVATAGAKGIVYLWDARSGEKLAELDGHQGQIHALTFSTNGQFLASASSDKTVRIWTSKPAAAARGD